MNLVRILTVLLFNYVAGIRSNGLGIIFTRTSKCLDESIISSHSYLNRTVSTVQPTDNEAHCSYICKRNPFCVVFEFDYGNKICYQGTACAFKMAWRESSSRECVSGVSVERFNELKPKIVTCSGIVVLYTMKSRINKVFYTNFMNPQAYKMPEEDESLPDIYRSDVLDNLPSNIKALNKTEISVQMITENEIKAEVVFDVTSNVDAITTDNWFTFSRFKSSFPFDIGSSPAEFNYFSIKGDASGVKRRLYIYYSYGGCSADKGFMTVIDAYDVCWYAHRYWTSPPLFGYNAAGKNNPMQTSIQFADRLLITLR